MPLPAPGTAELLRGIPLAESTADFEQTTPTGAAILATVAESFGPLPAMTIESIGLGAGTADPPGIANIVRLFVGTAATPSGSDRVWVLETNLDDLPGEVVGHATAQLLAAGALDAFVTPILMKKNRPGVMVTVLCDEPGIPAMEDILFRETTTLGIRRYAVSRHKLNRKAATVETTVRPRAGQARLARRPTAAVQPRVRRLRPRRRRARRAAPRGLSGGAVGLLAGPAGRRCGEIIQDES